MLHTKPKYIFIGFLLLAISAVAAMLGGQKIKSPASEWHAKFSFPQTSVLAVPLFKRIEEDAPVKRPEVSTREGRENLFAEALRARAEREAAEKNVVVSPCGYGEAPVVRNGAFAGCQKVDDESALLMTPASEVSVSPAPAPQSPAPSVSLPPNSSASLSPAPSSQFSLGPSVKIIE